MIPCPGWNKARPCPFGNEARSRGGRCHDCLLADQRMRQAEYRERKRAGTFTPQRQWQTKEERRDAEEGEIQEAMSTPAKVHTPAKWTQILDHIIQTA